MMCACAFGAMSQNGQIQNGGFENWTTNTLYDFPQQWGNSNVEQYMGVATVAKSTDATEGTYSAQISAALVGPQNDTIFGYVYHGSIGGSGPDGGIAYADAFNMVKYQYKCDIPAGDSLFMIMIRFTLGTMTEMIVEPAAWGTSSSFAQGTIAVSTSPQDELFIGFVMGNPMGGNNPAPGSWARIDDVQLFNNLVETTALPNQGFETWQAVSVESPNNWYTFNELYAGIGLPNANKSTDANTGTYALQLSTLNSPINGDTLRGILSMGLIDVYNGWSPFIPLPYNANPTLFTGSYTYAPSNSDNANIQIMFYQGGAIIGSHTENLTTNSTYTAISAPLTIIGTPDSIVFVAFAGNNPGSVLKLDDLSFSGGNVGLEDFENFAVSVYPNPAKEVVMIKTEGIYNFEIVNLSGAIVLSENNINGAKEVNISELNAGAYFVRISNSTSTEVHKLIIE